METILKNYDRCLLLQAQISELQREREAARRLALAAEREVSQKRVEWKCLEKPGFLQRLFGKTEEKREAAYRAYQEADAVWKNTCHASEQAAAAYQAAKSELDTLAAVPEQYTQLPQTQEMKTLAMEAFRPAVRYHLELVLSCLEQALQWENQERNVGGRMPNQEEGMWEQLSQAREPAKRLKDILEFFPEPDSWICDYLKNPDGFIYDGVIMKVSPRNKIRVAIGQMEKLKSKLQ